MKRLFTKYGIAMLLLAVLIAIILSVMSFLSTSSAILPNLAGMAAAPFRAAGSAISNTITHWTEYFTEFDRLKAENEALRQELAEKEASIRQAEQDREENKNFRTLMGFREQRRDLELEPSRVLETDSSNWASLLTINRGTDSGIETGDCVIDANGFLVGEISEAGQNWATVRTILDSETSFGAVVYRSGATAVAEGDFALMGEKRLKLNYLGPDPDIMVGDLVLTSGLGGFHPPDLTIGHIEETGTSENGLAQYAIVAPEMQLDSLSQVFVVKDFTIVD